ncbi:MAG: bifunctional adenosylcobinamide kinase/adenosylcobinamide-phosphate guanylyltransferase [Desulfocapsa sp.]|nr:MAG: bifunctional adenosylcobinamide kinase/adenosylcobinamide-phosphate guanylyltransferase [Desulfocapsa sp.]
MAQILFITGGARSGKSDYAQTRAEEFPGKHFFLATCPVVDQEMTDRIKRHQQGRKKSIWQTIEEEVTVSRVLDTLPEDSICLLDCLTLWVNNLLYRAELDKTDFNENTINSHMKVFLDAAEKYKGMLICVSNEVGMGIVPDNPAARMYRDCVGRCNRLLAAAADEVVLVSCGLPLILKKNDLINP